MVIPPSAPPNLPSSCPVVVPSLHSATSSASSTGDPVLIDTFVTNTTLYAADRGAIQWVPVTSEEMWRYLAIRTRQGIVVPPELHHYWEAGYRDHYTVHLSAHAPQPLH